MKIFFMILLVMILYLVSAITSVKRYGSITTRSSKEPTKIYQESTSLPRLLQWSSGISPNGKYLATSYTGDYEDRYHYYQVFVTNLITDRMHRIFSGDYRTLGWEWTSDNSITIRYDCGTDCLATKVIGVHESASMADVQHEGINEKNGWQVKSVQSF